MKIYMPDECNDHEVLSKFYHERPERLETLATLFNRMGLAVSPSNIASKEALELAHSPAYIESIQTSCNIREKYGAMPSILYNAFNKHTQWRLSTSPNTFNAALHAAGSVFTAIDDMTAGNDNCAFCAVRPPGHHAETAKGAGFCVFNNAALGAYYALNKGFKRVVVVDIDRHHGNGTEEIIRSKGIEDVMFVSSFQEGCKYASGVKHATEQDNIVSVPLAEHSDFNQIKEIYSNEIIPKIKAFEPELMIISAGFDMHIDDPLTNLKVEAQDFRQLTSMLVNAFDEAGQGRVLSILEGGYELEALDACVEQHIKALSI